MEQRVMPEASYEMQRVNRGTSGKILSRRLTTHCNGCSYPSLLLLAQESPATAGR